MKLKGILAIAIAMIMAVSMFALSGCELGDLIPNINDIIDKISDGEINIGGDDDSKVDSSAAEAKLAELEKTGYMVKFTAIADQNDENSTKNEGIIGVKGDYFWVISEGTGTALKMTSETTAEQYSYEDGEWTFCGDMDDSSAIASIVSTVKSNPILFQTKAYDSILKKVGTETVAGRPCTIYALSTDIVDQVLKLRWYLDDELGITMKVEVSNSDGTNDYVSFTVVEIAFGDNVEIPTLTK